MEDWVQLTEEDIERAQRLTREQSPTPEAITITMDDLPAGQRPPPQDGILTITDEDLAPAGAQAQPSATITSLERLMFALVNAARQDHLPGWVGTGQLRWHPDLAAAARQHSADMLHRQYVSHVTPEGVTAAQRISKHGVGYVACGENIGIVYGENSHGNQGVVEIHNAFMDQPRSLTNHRGNLLNPIWTHVGIGIAYNPDGALVVTQNFISAPGARLRGE